MHQLILADGLGHLSYAVKIKLAGFEELFSRLLVRKAVLTEFVIDNIKHLFKGIDGQQFDRDDSGSVTNNTIDIVSLAGHELI